MLHILVIAAALMSPPATSSEPAVQNAASESAITGQTPSIPAPAKTPDPGGVSKTSGANPEALSSSNPTTTSEASSAPSATTQIDSPKSQISPIPTPPVGKGQIVFFRPQNFVGMAISFKVRENDTELGTLSNGKYFIHETNPGPHVYVVHSEVKDTLVIEVEPGETYYVKGSISMGVMVGRPNISPSDEITFSSSVDKMKRSNSNTD